MPKAALQSRQVTDHARMIAQEGLELKRKLVAKRGAFESLDGAEEPVFQCLLETLCLGVHMYEKIDAARLDILREICSVGAGHAATALSQLTGRRITLEVPKVLFVPVQEVPQIAGGADTVVAGLYFRILGDARGVILMIFPEESARGIVRLVGGVSEPDLEDPMAVSAMQEIGNILTSAFLSAIGQLAGLSLIPSVPGYARDMAGSILDLVLIELSRLADTALVIETVFQAVGEGIRGHFFLLPDPHTLEATLRAAERAGSPDRR